MPLDLAQLSNEMLAVVTKVLEDAASSPRAGQLKQDEGAEAATIAALKSVQAADKLRNAEASQALWDQTLQSVVLSQTTGDSSTTDYGRLYNALDACLAAASSGICSDTLPIRLLEMLFESESLKGTEHIFAYVEARSSQLTQTHKTTGKAKPPLALLRMCNELLRRLSKSTHTVLCGRILLFLSASFPLGDQSAVNLRGAFNQGNATALIDPVWNMADAEAKMRAERQGENDDEDNAAPDSQQPEQEGDVDMLEAADEASKELPNQVTAKETTPVREAKDTSSANEKTSTGKESTAASEPDFYTLFWALQQIFSFPPSLFKADNLFPEFTPPPSVLELVPSSTSKSSPASSSSRSPSKTANPSASPSKSNTAASSTVPVKGSILPLCPNLVFFKYAVGKVLQRFIEINRKDKELGGRASATGSGSGSGIKEGKISTRALMQIDSSDVEAVKEHYFFPKYLTSRNLLELELADAAFRRQVIIQILVTTTYLRNHAASEQEKSRKTDNFNKTLLSVVSLGDPDLEWISRINHRAYVELRDIAPDGDRFASTVSVILSRDQHWFNWKLGSCKDFTQPALDAVAVSEEGRAKKRKVMASSRPFPFAMGTPGLSKLWSVNGGDALDLTELKHKEPAVDMENIRNRMADIIEQQEDRKRMMMFDEQPPSADELSNDQEWQALEDQKIALAWRRLRLSAAEDLAYFNRIKNGDVVGIFDNIEQAKLEAAQAEAEKLEKKAKAGSDVPASPSLEQAESNVKDSANVSDTEAEPAAHEEPNEGVEETLEGSTDLQTAVSSVQTTPPEIGLETRADVPTDVQISEQGQASAEPATTIDNDATMDEV